MITNLFRSAIIRVDRFDLSPSDPSFKRRGYIDYPVFVFPKNSIWIQHEGTDPFVADTSLVNFYNKGQVYSRYAINPDGDHCHVVSVSHAVMCEVLGEDRRQSQMFNFRFLPCQKDSFISHLQVLKELKGTSESNNLIIEERILNIFAQLIGQVKQTRDPHDHSIGKRHRDLVEDVKASLQKDLGRNISLGQLAKRHHTSPFHLSRVFKRVCGRGINQYRTQQRLRALLVAMQQGALDLGSLALEFGFNSHSHLSAQFKRYYGRCPSVLRESVTRHAI